MIALLSAGRSSRLGGVNKLLIEAGGARVHEWHQRAARGCATVAVTNSKDAHEVREEATWLSDVVEHDAYDGPVGALLAFDKAHPVGAVFVVFADSLVGEVPNVRGSWVGVADVRTRVWDFWSEEGQWSRDSFVNSVCCGIYRFTDRELLRKSLHGAIAEDSSGNMPALLNRYAEESALHALHFTDWQDAGDVSAVARVRPFKS